MNVRDMDLNLLVALEKLIELKSVSRAAEELGVTQPAMSNILSRLRKTFQDELLVKVGRAMDLTPKAREIAIPLQEIIHSIQERILYTRTFDPKVDEFHFKLAFHDYEQLIIYSRILGFILKNCPRISFEHIPPDQAHPTEDLGSGAIDFSSSPTIRDRSGIVAKKLFMDNFVCLADRHNYELKSKPLDTQLYAQLDHLFIAPHGGRVGQADILLQKKKLKRFVRMSITEFSTTPWLILNTNLIVTIPRRAAEIFASQHRDLVIHECPIKIDSVAIYLSWHERLNNSAPHQWLKNLIIHSTQT